MADDLNGILSRDTAGIINAVIALGESMSEALELLHEDMNGIYERLGNIGAQVINIRNCVSEIKELLS